MAVAEPVALSRIGEVLAALAAGEDDLTMLHRCVTAAAEVAGARHGALVAMVDGAPRLLAQTGDAPHLLVEVAEAALRRDAAAHRRDGSLEVSAVPICLGARSVAALAVGAGGEHVASLIEPFAGAAAVALSRRPATTARTTPLEALEAAAQVAGDPDEARVLVRALVAAERLFGARSSFVALLEDDRVRVAHHRGLDRDRLRDASRMVAFRTIATGPGLRVDPPGHPVTAALVDGLVTSVGVPLRAGGALLGRLVLLLPAPPDSGEESLLQSFADHLAASLRSAVAHRDAAEQHERLGATIHSLDDAVVMVDAAGDLRLANAAASALLQLPDGFAVGRSVRGLLGHAELEARLVAGEEGDLEVVLPTPEPRAYRATIRAVRPVGGRPAGHVLVLHDVTAARDAHQVKDDFVAVVSHELRTPLTVLRGYLALLARPDLDADARARAVEAASSAGGRLERLVEDLLYTAGLDGSRPVVELEPVDVGAILAAHGDDRVEVRLPQGGLFASVDRERVDRVVRHLVDNARAYSEGPILVEGKVVDGELEVAVVDRGEGIYSGDVATIFDRFRQLDGSSTRGHGGTGLGLYVCRRLVELHGGRIWCESKLGVGSRFAFRLPRGATATGGAAAGEAGRPAGATAAASV